MKIQIRNLRLAFPELFEARAGEEGGTPKYGAKFVVPANHPQIDEIEKAMFATAEAKWGGKAKTIYANLTKTGKPKVVEVAFVRQPYANSDGEPYDGFEDAFYLTASNKVRPTVIDGDRTPLTAADGKPYSGCYVNAIIEFWAQDNKYGRAVRAELKGVQFVKDGDAFGGGGSAASAEDFDVVDGSDAGDLA